MGDKTTMSSKWGRGFSAIELLAVVAIISILAALMFPVMKSAVRAAKITRSMNNMRQINLALHLYVQDHGKDMTQLDAYPRLVEPALVAYGASLELWNTGGLTADQSIPPYAFLIGGLQIDNDIARWELHLQRTGRNPLILIDGTQEKPHNAFDPFSPSLAFAIYADSHITKKRVKAYPYRLELWEPTQ